MPWRTRIAPTPSGFLHAGNAVNFLIAFKLARAVGGSVLLRIDDLDAERMRPEYLDDIFRSLEWLGIAWDEGPTGPDDFLRGWSQRSRIDRYQGLADALRAGGHLYACGCSRARAVACACGTRGLPFDAPGMSWRLRVAPPCPVAIARWPRGTRSVDLATAMPHPVLRRRDGRPAYQLASLADDVEHRIDLVVRGEDLLPSTACQLHIANVLGLSAFSEARFVHHPVLLDEQGGKLSKSEGASSLKAMREAGIFPMELHATAGRMIELMAAGSTV